MWWWLVLLSCSCSATFWAVIDGLRVRRDSRRVELLPDGTIRMTGYPARDAEKLKNAILEAMDRDHTPQER